MSFSWEEYDKQWGTSIAPGTVAQQTVPSLAVENRVSLPALLDEAYKGVLNSTDTTQASFYGLAGIVGAKFGIDTLRDWGFEGYKRNMEEASQYVAAVDDVTEIKSLADVMLWGANGLGQLSVNALVSIGGAGLGAVVAKYGVQQTAKQIAAGLVEKGVAKEVAAQTAAEATAAALAKREMIGIGAGMYAASAGQEIGSIGGDIYEQTGRAEPNIAIVGGAAAGALDVLPEVRAAKTLLGKRAVGGAVKEVAIQAALEGATEAAQTVIERASVGKAMSGSWAGRESMDYVFSDEGIRDIINATALGSLGGGVIGGASTIANRLNLAKSIREINDEVANAPMNTVLTPEQVRNLPALYRPTMAVDSEGVAREMSQPEMATAEQQRMAAQEIGLTPDVVAAQVTRGMPSEAAEAVAETRPEAPVADIPREQFLGSERALRSPAVWAQIDLAQPADRVAESAKAKDLIKLADTLGLNAFEYKSMTDMAQAVKDRRDAVAQVNAMSEQQLAELPVAELKTLAETLGAKADPKSVMARADEITEGFRQRVGSETHRTAVEAALMGGQTVRQEVLQDYPDLTARYTPRSSEEYKAAIERMATERIGKETSPKKLAEIATRIRNSTKGKDYTDKEILTDLSSAILAKSKKPAPLKEGEGISKLTGLPDRASYDVQEKKKPVVAYVNLDNIARYNERFSLGDGDRVINAFGEVLRESGYDAYHMGGDRFAVQFDDEAEAYLAMDALQRAAKETEMEFHSGGKHFGVSGLTFKYGVGKTLTEAGDVAGQEESRRTNIRERRPEGVEAVPAADSGVRQGGEPGPRGEQKLASKLTGVRINGRNFGLGYANVESAEVSIETPLEDGGTAYRTVNAASAMRDIDSRIDSLESLVDCLG